MNPRNRRNRRIRRLFRPAACAALALVVFSLFGCPPASERSEIIDPSTLPENVRADYDVFAQRCSKCHSLARPLNSGIVDDDYWAMYVARMRRQPESGISLEDSRVVLRFLHYYSQQQIEKKKAKRQDSSSPPPPDPSLALPPSDAGASQPAKTSDAG